jgi:hypothetical protein
MRAVPALTPDVTPVESTTVALATLLLLQVPPAGDDVSAVVLPVHTDAVPAMTAGKALIVAIFVFTQVPSA